MKVEGYLFLGCAGFFGASDIVYWYFAIPRQVNVNANRRGFAFTNSFNYRAQGQSIGNRRSRALDLTVNGADVNNNNMLCAPLEPSCKVLPSRGPYPAHQKCVLAHVSAEHRTENHRCGSKYDARANPLRVLRVFHACPATVSYGAVLEGAP